MKERLPGEIPGDENAKPVELLMIAIVGMGVIVHPARFIIDDVCNHNSANGRD